MQRVDDLIDSRLMARLDTLDVVSRKVFLGKVQGERRSRRKGQSVEFADFRPYAPGDDLRFVDWNVYGRLDRLFLKMFLEEEDLSLLFAIDASRSMAFGSPSKFDFVRRVAMALGYIGLVNQSRVGCFAFGGPEGTARITGLRGRRRVRELGEWLLALQPGGEFDFAAAMRSIALGGQGRGVLVVLSDFLVADGTESGLRAIAGRGFDVFAMQCLAPEEVDPGGHIHGDVRLVDAERGTAVEMSVTSRALEAYRERRLAHWEALRSQAVRRGISAMSLRTDMPLDELLLDYLRRRGLLT